VSAFFIARMRDGPMTCRYPSLDVGHCLEEPGWQHVADDVLAWLGANV